ncbi:MAG: DNA-protecting protein DprA [Candidatus Marinimicrobia bacterium]|nr:DNA-protecting protein DprA [Candidatus Neomarinimicrobiota bacterium]
MNHEQIVALLNLQNVKGVGPQKVRHLVTFFKDPKIIFEQDRKSLCRVESIDIKSADRIRAYCSFDYGHSVVESCKKIDARILTFWNADYPLLLKKIYDPPPILYVLGQVIPQVEDCIALVGSRTTTAYGRSSAIKITRRLVELGLTTVSGLARGIDSVVHRETVAAGGRTIAVLGSGVDIIYPAENRKLALDLQNNGLLLSEYPPGTKPDARNFPQRNRIISGLAHATVIIEAGNRSGAILTALNAIDQNRDLFALPGRITDKQSVGCVRLISHGAVPVTTPEMIYEGIRPRLAKPGRVIQQEIELDLTDQEREVLGLLSTDPVHIDDIAKNTNLDISHLLTILLQLELKNAVVQMSGKQFVTA